MSLDLNAIAERYHRALEAKPSKGPITERGIAAVTDSVADVPDLVREVGRLQDVLDRSICVHGSDGDYLCTLIHLDETSLSARAENAESTLRRLRSLVSDWQSNGNSRELGDPRADVWQACARQLLEALNPEEAEHV